MVGGEIEPTLAYTVTRVKLSISATCTAVEFFIPYALGAGGMAA